MAERPSIQTRFAPTGVFLRGRRRFGTVNEMEPLPAIQGKIASGAFEYSQHAVDQSILRRVSVQELQDAVAAGEMFEDYPNDKYGPSC